LSCIPYFKGDSPVHRLDPRARLITAFLFAILAAISSSFVVLSISLVMAFAAIIIAGIDLHAVSKRLGTLNFFLVFLFLLLPLSTPGATAFSLAGLNWSFNGLEMATRITLRANSIMLCYTALISTMSPVVMGHALQKLKMPWSLIQMLMLTIRYVGVLIEEYRRLLRSMRLRHFRPGFNRHTFRSYGYLVGMLLVRSFERSERILAAMKCRGYQGRFHMIDELAIETRDAIYLSIFTITLFIMGLMQWLWLTP